MRKLLILQFMIACIPVSALAVTIHVPGDQPTIQAGVDASVNGDTVLVSAGTYFENINFNGREVVLSSLFLTTGDTTYITQTVIDGSLSGSVVTFDNGEGGDASLIGFTLTNGMGEGEDPYFFGGGITCHDESSPTLRNLIISNNFALVGGGLFCIYGSSPSLEDVQIIGNIADYNGGILCVDNSDVSLASCVVAENTDGGIACYFSSATINDTHIINNTGEDDCSAISAHYSGEIIISNSVIEGNSDDYGEGCMCFNEEISLYISGVQICNNTSQYGILGCSWGGSADIRNTLIAENTVLDGRDVIGFTGMTAALTNVTLADNLGLDDEFAGFQLRNGATLMIENMISYGNGPLEGFFSDTGEPNTVYVSCSDIEGGEAGIETNDNGTVHWLENNIDANPMFCDPENGDYRLQLDSQCRTDICGFMGYTGETCEGEGVDKWISEPIGFYLANAYPNPFNPSTTIEYNLTFSSEVLLSVYNISGQLVDVVQAGFVSAGHHNTIWIPSDLPSGVYLVDLQASGVRDVMKISYLK